MMLEARKGSSTSPAKVIVYMTLTIMLVIIVTELLEFYLRSSEIFEGFIHVLALSVLLAPLFFFFWYRPLTRQIEAGKASEKEIRNLSHQLMEASELERRKLARDLHDVFGQKLTSLQIHLDNLQQTLAEGASPSPDICSPLLWDVDGFGTDLRNVLANLRPAALDDLGLTPALESLCTRVSQQQSSLKIDFRCAGLKERLDQDVETALFRCCQEALTNIVKHAGASHAEVVLLRSYPRIILTISDDGVGMPPGGGPDEGKLADKFGLIGMRERVSSVGGNLRIASKPEDGVRIRIEVPETSGGTGS